MAADRPPEVVKVVAGSEICGGGGIGDSVDSGEICGGGRGGRTICSSRGIGDRQMIGGSRSGTYGKVYSRAGWSDRGVAVDALCGKCRCHGIFSYCIVNKFQFINTPNLSDYLNIWFKVPK